jgi:signal transduction histidine kinase
MFSLKRQQRDKPEPITAHERLTDAILRNSDQGLFLLDSSGRIVPPMSRALTTLFRRPDIAHLAFERLLAPLVSADTLLLVQSHMRRLLGGAWDDGEPVNVLKDIEVSLPNTDGPADSAHIWFAFDPIEQPFESKAWLVRVTDVTLQVRTLREVEGLRSQVRTQSEVLRGVLQMGRGWFGNFVQTTDMSLKTSATLLKRALREQTVSWRKLDQMQGEIDRVWRDAGDCKLAALEHAARGFGANLQELRQRPASGGAELSGVDLLPLTAKMAELQKQFVLVRSIMRSALDSKPRASPATEPPTPGPPSEKAPRLAPAAATPEDPGAAATTPAAGLDETLHDLTAELAEREKKAVIFESVGLQLVPPRYQSLVRNVAAQLISNAIMHGIEPPAVRETAGKPPHGTLRLEFRLQDERFELAFVDDGAGLDPAQMRAAAVERGVVSNEVAARMGDREAIKLIFKPRFTTRDAGGADKPHGAGMSLVRRAVQGCGGTIALASVHGHATRFKITLPALALGTTASQALPQPPQAALRLANGATAY